MQSSHNMKPRFVSMPSVNAATHNAASITTNAPKKEISDIIFISFPPRQFVPYTVISFLSSLNKAIIFEIC